MKKNKSIHSLLQSALAAVLGLQALPAFCDDAIQLANNKWYERSFDQLLKTKIITATRDEEELSQSPSNISVYSADDIKRMGIRTLKELLERTPGFFINQQLAGPSLGSRGFISDNEQFLLLIDGHSTNSIVEKGAGYFFLFPFLEHVERIEILRGPGSTLWGSDAALGIVHIITKNGQGVNGIKATVSTASADNLRYINVQAGKSISDNVNYMFSFTSAASNGFPDEPIPYLPKKGRWDKLGDSSELYFKAQLDEITVFARSADMINQKPGGSSVANQILGNIFDPDPNISGPALALFPLYEQLQDNEYFNRRKHDYLDIQHKHKFTGNLNLETRFFSDRIQAWQAVSNPVLSNSTPYVEESGDSNEQSLGIESILKLQIPSNHKLLVGIRAVQTEIDPVANDILYPTTSTPNTTTTYTIRTMRVVPDSKDENYAVFAEDDWAIIPNLHMTYGLRVDTNTLREKSTILLPKLSFDWQIDPHWITQYSYTTGYIRPPAGIGFLGQAQYNTNLSGIPGSIIYGAQDSEEVQTHNLSFGYNNDPYNIKLNLYETNIDKSFNFLYARGIVNTNQHVLFYTNLNKIKTQGAELEFNYIASSAWNVYGNLSYVIDAELNSFTGSEFGVSYDITTNGFGMGTFTPDGTMTGYPHEIWNFGANAFFTDHLNGNLHFHGWADMYARDRLSEFSFGPKNKKYGPENFLDLNIRYEKIADTNLDIGVFVKNILDNDDSKINMLYYTREWSALGRSLGMDISYTF